MNQAAVGFHNVIALFTPRSLSVNEVSFTGHDRYKAWHSSVPRAQRKKARMRQENLFIRTAFALIVVLPRLAVAHPVGSAALSRFHALHTAALCNGEGTKRDFRRRIFHGLRLSS